MPLGKAAYRHLRRDPEILRSPKGNKTFPTGEYGERLREKGLELLAEAAVAAVLDGFQILPLTTHVLVGLHLGHGLGPLESLALEPLDEVVEDEGIGTLRAVFGQHSYE